MKWFFKPCRRYRQNICLLASDALPEEQKAEAQDHLTSCADCRKYFEELKALTRPLSSWEKSFAHLEATASLQLRWSKAIQTQTKAKSRFSAPMPSPRSWREVLLSLRWHLAGMGALWMIAAFLNIEPASTPTTTAQSKPAPQQLLMALRENRRQLSELINGPSTDSDVLPEVFVPRRRSEIQLPTAMA